MSQRSQRILEDVGGICSAHHSNSSDVSEFEVFWKELTSRQNDCSLCQDISDSSSDFLLGPSISYGVCRHIEEEEIALFSSEDAFVDQALSQPFSDLLQLVSDLH